MRSRVPRLRRPDHSVHRGERPVEAIVVTLHGGPERGFWPTPAWSAPYLRMIPFGERVRELSQDRIAVVRLRHTQTGWNGRRRTTVGQATWLLGDIAQKRPGMPIGLLGHSLGGRTAFAAAAFGQVTSVVALAPWVTESDPVEHLRDVDTLVIQGDRDGVCPPEDSRAFVERVRASGGRIAYEEIPGAGHMMLREHRRWHDLAARHLVRTLLPPA